MIEQTERLSCSSIHPPRLSLALPRAGGRLGYVIDVLGFSTHRGLFFAPHSCIWHSYSTSRTHFGITNARSKPTSQPKRQEAGELICLRRAKLSYD